MIDPTGAALVDGTAPRNEQPLDFLDCPSTTDRGDPMTDSIISH